MTTRAASRRYRISLETPAGDEYDNLGSSHGGTVHPYIEEDLKDSRKVEIHRWIEAVFGVSRTRIDEWASQIGEQRWFFDPEI